MRVEFPAMLHKLGSMFDWNGVMCDYVIVADQDEADIALADGWVFGFPVDAEPAPVEPTPAEPAAVRRGRPPKNKEAE